MYCRTQYILVGFNTMDLKLAAVSILVLACSGIMFAKGDVSCQPKVAEVCLADRSKEYNSVLSQLSENVKGDDTSYRQMCVEQLRPYDSCFYQKTKTCDPNDILPTKTQWNALSLNITEICLTRCPSMMEIASCKNLTDTSDFKHGLFEKFCRTFNSSLRCAVEVIAKCDFGVQFYADLLQPDIMQYWKYICNSGCHNIDETVTAIVRCGEHLSGEDICWGHNLFKQCVANASNVCKEVMKIVRFQYRKYDDVDRRCITTSTAEAVTTISGITDTTTRSQLTSTIPDANECLEDIDIGLLEVYDDVDVTQILLLLQIESCLHNKTSTLTTPEELIESLGQKFVNFYQAVKQNGWMVLKESMRKCRVGQESSTGCSGHRYGMLACNAGNGLFLSFGTLMMAITLMSLI